MATTDNSIDALVIDGGLVIGDAVHVTPPMYPPVRRAEQASVPTATRVDE